MACWWLWPLHGGAVENAEGTTDSVYRNNDGDHELLVDRFSEVETAEIQGRSAEVVTDDVRIALPHGEEEDLLQSLIHTGHDGVVVHGHTHEAATYRHGQTVVINPGEVCGCLSNQSTLALFDTTKHAAQIVRL